MTDIRKLVIAALDDAAGILGNPVFAEALMRGEDIALEDLEVDSLTRFEVIMQIEDSLGIELDDDEVTAQVTLNQLVAHITRQTSIARQSGADAAV